VDRVLAEEERHIQERERLKRSKGDVEELLNCIGKEFGVSKGERIGGGQRQVITRVRSVF